jgi:drug/metabolite transporter (DMT)-like permease
MSTFFLSPPILLCLLAAFMYATGALVVKRAAEFGVGVWRTAFVANVLCAFVFQPLLLLGGNVLTSLWWQPLVTGACFVAGQWLTFIALERGDVSVATPVLGLKIIFVALLVTFLVGEALRWQLWIAALLATGGIALLNWGGGGRQHHDVGRTIVAASSAAGVYAVFDVLVQTWAPRWGLGRFLPFTMGCAGLLSLAFIPRFRAPLRTIPRAGWPWLVGGSLLLGLQSVIFVSTLAHWGRAAANNVVYSSRGLWTILLVWLVGHWVGSREQAHGSRILAWRLVGATLMLSAIGLVAF